MIDDTPDPLQPPHAAALDPEVSTSTLVTPPDVVAGAFDLPLISGPSAPPPTFWPKRRNLGLFTTAAATPTALTGGATKADDTSDPYIGNTASSAYPANMGTSPRITLGSGAAVTAIPAGAPLPALNLTGCNVYLAFKVLPGGASGPGSITAGIRLYTGGTVNASGGNYLQCTRVNWNATLEWQVLGFAIEDFTAFGNAQLSDIAAITHAGARLGGVSVGTQILLGGVFVCPKQLNRAAAVIAFDDCRADTWTDASFELAKRGFPGTLFPGAVAAMLRAGPDQFQMSVAQMQKLCRLHGWQVASQAWSTENPPFGGDQAMSEMASQRALWVALGVNGGGMGSYFSNNSPNALDWKAARRTNFPMGMRGFNVGASGSITAKVVLPETFPIADPNYVTALGIDLNVNTGADLINFASYAAASRGLAIFVFHVIPSGNAAQFAKFTGLLDYLDSRRDAIEVCTYERAIQQGYSYPL